MHDPNQYYLFLGVTPAASQGAIVQAHRDRIRSAQVNGGFLLEMINEAFACLSNPTTRARYNAGSFPMNTAIRAFREMLLADGRLHEFDRLAPEKRIAMYCEVLGAEDATVEFGLNPNGTLEDLKTGQKLDIVGPKAALKEAGGVDWRSTNTADPKGYYAYFGLSPDASLRDIVKAYSDILREYSGNPIILSMAQEAYAVLCDPLMRHAYDTSARVEIREGNVSLTVDSLPTTGAMLSGKVCFHNRQQAHWHINQMGRLILLPSTEGYQPSMEDGDLFIRLVNGAIDSHNRASHNPPHKDSSYRTMGKPSTGW